MIAERRENPTEGWEDASRRFAGDQAYRTEVFTTPNATGEGNYVIFRNLRSPSFTLTANPGTGMHAPVNGLQIVSPSGSC